MKLQINEAGSWRNVLSFNPEQRTNVEEAAVMLAKAADLNSSLSILDEVGARIAICRAPDYTWKAPHWRLS